MSYHITAMTHKAECIRLINKALENPMIATSDATIAAVLMLAVEEVSSHFNDLYDSHDYEWTQPYVLLSFSSEISTCSKPICVVSSPSWQSEVASIPWA